MDENTRFYPSNVERFQDFLLDYARLPINDRWDSLGIGTMQGYLREKGYYHENPCGVFGPGTVRSLQHFLADRGFHNRASTGQ